MKKFKSFVAAALVASVIFGATGCSMGKKKFEATTKKDFKNALEDVLDLDDDDYNSVANPTSIYSYSYVSPFLDGMDLLDEYEIAMDIEYSDGDDHYYFMEFDDEEDALEFFEDTFYDAFQDVIKDKDFEGKYFTYLDEEMGYVIVHGESDSDDFFDDDIVGGFFVKDGVFVAVYTLSDKDSHIEDINAFLEAIGYPKA